MGQQEQLQSILSSLSDTDRHAWLRYGEFLVSSAATALSEQPTATIEKEAPQPIARPDEERVVAAIRRLAQTYPMINHDPLLQQSADLMSAHLLSGRAAAEVIDELEELFQQHYQRYLAES